MDDIKSIGLRVLVVRQATLVNGDQIQNCKFKRGTSQHKMTHQDAGKVHCNCVRDHAKSVKRSNEKSNPSRTILQIFHIYQISNLSLSISFSLYVRLK